MKIDSTKLDDCVAKMDACVKSDDWSPEAREAAAKARHNVHQKTSSGGSKFVSQHNSKEEATAHASRLNKGRSPHNQRHSNTGYIVRPHKE